MRARFVPTPVLALSVLLLFELLARTLNPHLPEPARWGNPFTDAKAAQIERLIATDRHVDVILAGSSIVNAGLDPTRFADAGPRPLLAYNAAIPGVSMRYVDAWTREIVLPRLCPSLLVVGVTIRDYNDRGAGNGSALARYRDATPRLVAIDRLEWSDRLEQFLFERSELVRLRSRLREPANVVRWLRGERVRDWPPRRLTSLGRYTGFDNDTYVQTEGRRRGLRRAFVKLRMGGVEEEALERLVKTARDRGTSVVILEMPTFESRLVEFLPDGRRDLERFRASIDGVAARTGVPLLRFDGLVDRETLFADEYHLNGEGTPRLTDALVSSLSPTLAGLPEGGCDG